MHISEKNTLETPKNNIIDKQYLSLVSKILNKGNHQETRNGVGCLSSFGEMLRIDVSEKFPIITSRQIYGKNITAELMGFLGNISEEYYLNNCGKNNIKFLVDNNVNIGTDICLKYYAEKISKNEFIDKIKHDGIFAEKFGNIGNIYGNQGTNFFGKNQIDRTIKLLKKSPYRKDILISNGNPSDFGIIPDCHYAHQFYVIDDKISLSFNLRASDVMLGLPYDIALYTLGLNIIAKETGYKPNELVIFITDAHIYNNHIENAKYMLENTQILESPTLNFDKKDLYEYKMDDFKIIDYVSSMIINFELNL